MASLPRDWSLLQRRHRAFWECAEIDRPLVGLTYEYYVDTELVAAAMGDGELLPEHIDPRPLLGEYDRVAAARELAGDDVIAVAEPLLGIPWLEAICGCRVLVADGKSLWPAPPETPPGEIRFSQDNPWFRKLLQVIQAVVAQANGRYAVSLSHLRGPSDVLVALLGSQSMFYTFFDQPERIHRLAGQAAAVWQQVAQAQTALVPAYRGGYAVRQFGLWAPQRAAWLQDDTSGMISLGQYRQLFLDAIRAMSIFPYGVLHLHIPSLHLAETFAQIEGVRAINLYFDSPTRSIQDALPTLRTLQAQRMPLILAKDVYAGFNLDEYAEILDGLSPRGLSVHLKAETLEEAHAVMEFVNRWGAGKGRHQHSAPRSGE